MPISARTSSAPSASSGLSMKSRSCVVSGPPRAQLARLPPSRNGMPASRSAAAAFLRDASISLNGCSSEPMTSIDTPAAVGNEPFVPLKPPGAPEPSPDGRTVRIAASGDIHITEANCEAIAQAFSEVDEAADLILLAGDLTTHGEPEQAELMADAVQGLETPVITVLGNHDWHVNRVPELMAILQD